jgi:cysteine desulfurase family protein
MIRYFDNAASSWPKPPNVIEVMKEMMELCTANPGRGGHQMAVRASRVLFETRKTLAKLFAIHNPNDVFFTLNTTMALNIAIQGFLRGGEHVISTSIEHNSVRRPLENMRRERNVEVTYLENAPDGTISLAQFEQSFQKNTKLVVVNHSSNLLGTIMPIEEISSITKKHGAYLLVDAAQTAGMLPIDVKRMGIDMLAFPGHKGLLGPQGTGGLYIAPELELEPLIVGGTGSQSEQIHQPLVRPDRYEAGTPNTVGIAGLGAGTKFVLQETVEKIHHKENMQIHRLMEKLLQIDGLRLLGPAIGKPRTGICSFLLKNIDPSELAFILDQNFQIAVRAGYHCTPLAHSTAGTLDNGAVRASISYFTTDDDIDYFVESIKQISKHYS